MKNLEGKVAFVTGGAGGIGLGMAKAFLKQGMKVVIADIRAERLQKAEAELKAISDDVRSIEMDLCDPDALERAADETEAAFDKVHVLCNNAGLGQRGAFLETSTEQWEQIMDVNVWAVVRGARAFLPRIQRHGEGGHIVNTASITGMFVTGNQPIYGTSKFAVVGFSEFLRDEFADKGVSVSVLCPFVVDTNIFYADFDDDDKEGIAAKRKSLEAAYKIAVDPEFVGELVVNGIRNDELYIFCDGKESRKMVELRMQSILDALDRQFPQ